MLDQSNIMRLIYKTIFYNKLKKKIHNLKFESANQQITSKCTNLLKFTDLL